MSEQLTCALCGAPFRDIDVMVDVGEGPNEVIVHVGEGEPEAQSVTQEVEGRLSPGHNEKGT